MIIRFSSDADAELAEARQCAGSSAEKLAPEWIPERNFLSYFVGVILILASVCTKKSAVEPTPKEFANSSPVLRFGNPGKTCLILE